MLSTSCCMTSKAYFIGLLKDMSYFFDQMPRLLFEGGVYFFGKPADINDGLIRYVRVRR